MIIAVFPQIINDCFFWNTICSIPKSNCRNFITSWGSLLLEGQTSLNANPYMLLIPAICVALVVLAFTFIGDGLRDALDPRMRGTQ